MKPAMPPHPPNSLGNARIVHVKLVVVVGSTLSDEESMGAVRLATAGRLMTWLLLCLLMPSCLYAGMGGITFQYEVPEHEKDFDDLPVGPAPANPASSLYRWQAFSFFAATILGSAAIVQWLWNILAKDFSSLPTLKYTRALSFVLLWGLLAVIVLTMVSGARELMTPGAWRKQGWTYQLANQPPPDELRLARRKAGLSRLKDALWQYAAEHEGSFPTSTSPEIPTKYWHIPGWGETRYLYVPKQSKSATGSVLAYEPEFDGSERIVLLTNGVIGILTTTELDSLLQAEPASVSSRK
jgi:hypothetical protein